MAKVMVVDDEADIVGLIKLLLEHAGHEILAAYTGEECLVKLDRHKEKKPSLILLDIMLPGMNGWEVLKAIRQKKEFDPVKVIFVSVRQPSDFKETEKLKKFYHDYIVKPFNNTEFVETVNMHLEA